MQEPLGHLTSVLHAMAEPAGEGTPGPWADLFERAQQELHRLAKAILCGERNDSLPQTTALVHEAFVRLATARHVSWQNRAHFFGAAAITMRRVLVDHARSRRAAKRGGNLNRLPWSSEAAGATLAPRELDRADMLDLDAALEA